VAVAAKIPGCAGPDHKGAHSGRGSVELRNEADTYYESSLWSNTTTHTGLDPAHGRLLVRNCTPEVAMIISEALQNPPPKDEFLRTLRPTLTALLQPMDAEGAAVIDNKDGGPVLLCEAGQGCAVILNVTNIIATGLSAPAHEVCSDGRPILAGPWRTPTGRNVVVVFWRKTGGEQWGKQDYRLILMAAAALGAVPLNFVRLKEPAWRGPVDDLTGLPRARKLVEDLPRYFARLDRDGLPGTLIIASIDDIKRINEAFGHETSDDILRQIAKSFQASIRPTDVVARLAGEDFAIWLNAVEADASRLAAALRQPGLCVSLSIGIATRRSGSGETIISLMRRADHAMHEARDAGHGNWRVSQEKVR
jgi:diguanylate cyclase (GGDEF)-like protein